MQDRTGDWPGLVTEAAIETLKVAGAEYAAAIVDGKIAKPVEYQDARGFIWQAERMIESVSAALEKKNPEALASVRTDFAELKKAFPIAHAAAGSGQESCATCCPTSRASSLRPAS